MKYDDSNEVKFAPTEDFTIGEYKLNWPERSVRFVEELLKNVLVEELGNGPFTNLAKLSLIELYTETGLERVVDDFANGGTDSMNKALSNIAEQVSEALILTEDYALVRETFHKLLTNHYITSGVNKDEKLEDDSRFELALRYFALIRAIRYVFNKHRKDISRAIEDLEGKSEK